MSQAAILEAVVAAPPLRSAGQAQEAPEVPFAAALEAALGEAEAPPADDAIALDADVIAGACGADQGQLLGEFGAAGLVAAENRAASVIPPKALEALKLILDRLEAAGAAGEGRGAPAPDDQSDQTPEVYELLAELWALLGQIVQVDGTLEGGEAQDVLNADTPAEERAGPFDMPQQAAGQGERAGWGKDRPDSAAIEALTRVLARLEEAGKASKAESAQAPKGPEVAAVVHGIERLETAENSTGSPAAADSKPGPVPVEEPPAAQVVLEEPTAPAQAGLVVDETEADAVEAQGSPGAAQAETSPAVAAANPVNAASALPEEAVGGAQARRVRVSGERGAGAGQLTDATAQRPEGAGQSHRGAEAPPGADQERLIARIASAITQAKAGGNTTVRMRLYPPDLGTVRIEVSSVRGAVTARIETSTQGARQVLSTNLAALRENIRAAGVNLRDMQVDYRSGAGHFGLGRQARGRAGQTPQRRWESRRAQESAREVEAPRFEPLALSRGVLDLLM